MTRRYDSQEVRRRTISAGIKLFIEKGYHKTTVSDICRLADVSNGSFFNVFRTKNGLLMELVVNMFNGQFDAADSLLPADSEPHMLYVFETAIQLAIAETSENLRDIYVEAYTNRETLCYIHDRTAARLFELFRPFNPDWSESRCFETEIGTAAVMSGTPTLYHTIDIHPESGDKRVRFTVTNLYCFRVTLIKKFIDYSNTGIYRIFISAAKVLKLGRFLSSSTSYGMLR